MKSIKERAEEYAATGKVSGTEAIRKRAYLAGAKRALALAKVKFTEYGFDQIEQEDAASILQNLIPE